MTLGKAGASLPGLTLIGLGAEGPGGCKLHCVVSTGVWGLQDLPAQARPPLCRRRWWRRALQDELDLFTEEALSWGGRTWRTARQRPGPGPETQRGGSVAGPDREEAGGQVKPLGGGAWGLGPGLSLRRGEELACPEP